MKQIEIHRDDRRTDTDTQSLSDSDSDPHSDDDTGSSRSYESDPEVHAPRQLEDGASPVEDMQSFDWGGADDELNDFLNEDDSEAERDDSGAESDDSRKFGSVGLRQRDWRHTNQ